MALTADEPLTADQAAGSDRQEPDTVAVEEPVPPANEATTAEADAGSGPAVAASD